MPNDATNAGSNFDICQNACTENSECQYIFFGGNNCILFRSCDVNDLHSLMPHYGFTGRKQHNCRNDWKIVFLNTLCFLCMYLSEACGYRCRRICCHPKDSQIGTNEK